MLLVLLNGLRVREFFTACIPVTTHSWIRENGRGVRKTSEKAQMMTEEAGEEAEDSPRSEY